jgi:hypothetical protein
VSEARILRRVTIAVMRLAASALVSVMVASDKKAEAHMSGEFDEDDAKTVRRAARVVCEFANNNPKLSPELAFSIGVVIGAALRGLAPPREEVDPMTALEMRKRRDRRE